MKMVDFPASYVRLPEGKPLRIMFTNKAVGMSQAINFKVVVSFLKKSPLL